MAKSLATHQILLSEFVDGLPEEATEGATEAARTMMQNERYAATQRGVERELLPYFLFGLATFAIGLTILLFFSEPGGFLDNVTGGWMLLTAALAFLPGLIGYYAFRVRRRTQADAENVSLNQEWFIPHGAIYFPSDAPAAEQMVTLISPDAQAKATRKSRYENVRPGTIW